MTAAGMLVMLVAAVIAWRYTPLWLDPEEGCALAGRCVTPTATAALTTSWWLVATGSVVLVIGLALTWRGLPSTPRPATPFPLPAWGQAGSAALAGLVLSAALGPVLLLAFVAAQAIPVGLCLFWLSQAYVITVLDRRTGPEHRSIRVEWSIGLVAGALAVTVAVGLTFSSHGAVSFPAVDAAVLAVVVLVARVLPRRPGGPHGSAHEPAPVHHGAGAVIAAVAVGVVAFLVVPTPGTSDLAAPPEPPARVPAPPPERPTQAPPPPPAPAPVEATAECTPADLTWSTTGWDAVMGTRAVTVVAAHHGRRPCYLDGFAGVTIAQAGRPLQLVIEPGSISSPGRPVTARRVGVAPGGTASFTVSWKGYGAAADQTDPQSLGVVLPGTTDPSDVALSDGPAPFDVIDGATVHVDAWRAGLP